MTSRKEERAGLSRAAVINIVATKQLTESLFSFTVLRVQAPHGGEHSSKWWGQEVRRSHLRHIGSPEREQEMDQARPFHSPPQ